MGKRKPSNTKVAVAYLRVSTDDQRLGPEAQREQITIWAKRDGAEVVAWFEDHGVSGGVDLADRPQLVCALAALRDHGAGVLVVAKRDRLARDVGVAGMIERAAVKAGARIEAADGVGNGEGAADQFMRTIVDGAAQYERAIIRQRTKAAMAVMRARGERVGSVPFGYRLAADGVHLEELAEEQAIIANVRSLRAEGVSFRAIVDALESVGIRSRGGSKLGLSQVAKLAQVAA